MAIFNMVGSGSGGGGGVIVPLDAIDDLDAKSGNAKATITWTDPTNPVYNGITLVSWSSTVLVRKTGSAPSNSSDGTVVVTETTRNQYSSSGYVDTGLTNGTTYYYAAFAIGDNGTESAISNTVSVIPDPNYLCFTANTAGSTIQLTKVGSPNIATFETSTDQNNWTTYTIGDTITLSNIGDKVYWRNKGSNNNISSSSLNYYNYVMTGSIAASGNLNYLQKKNPVLSLGGYCFYGIFKGCTALTTAPELPATTLTGMETYGSMFYGCTSLTTAPKLPATSFGNYAYQRMFYGCTSLTTIPSLPATTLTNNCYYYMFDGCSLIKISSDQSSEYPTAYRIPSNGTGTVGSNSLYLMFRNTGGTFTSTPTINTTYYTSNTVITND